MLMVVLRQTASVKVQKETSLSWLYFKYLEIDFDVICRRIDYG